MDSYLADFVSSLQEAARLSIPVAQNGVPQEHTTLRGASRNGDGHGTFAATAREGYEMVVTVDNASVGECVKFARHYSQIVLASSSHRHFSKASLHGRIDSVDVKNFMCTVQFSDSTRADFSLGPEESTLVFVLHTEKRADYTRFENGDCSSAQKGNQEVTAGTQQAEVDLLVSMGFEKNLSVEALLLAEGDVAKGVDFAVSISAAQSQEEGRKEESAAEFWAHHGTNSSAIQATMQEPQMTNCRTNHNSERQTQIPLVATTSEMGLAITLPGQHDSPQHSLSSPASGRLQTNQGLGMRVVEKGDGVFIGQMAIGGVAAAAEPFLQIGDRILSIDAQAVRTEGDVKHLAGGAHGTPLMLHCSRRSARPGTSQSDGVRVVSLVTLVRGIPGAHTVHTKRVRHDEALASVHHSLATWTTDNVQLRPPPPPRLLSSPSSPAATPSPTDRECLRRSGGIRHVRQTLGRACLQLGKQVVVLAGQQRGNTGRLVAIRGEEAVVHLSCGLRAFKSPMLAPATPQQAQLGRLGQHTPLSRTTPQRQHMPSALQGRAGAEQEHARQQQVHDSLMSPASASWSKGQDREPFKTSSLLNQVQACGWTQQFKTKSQSAAARSVTAQHVAITQATHMGASCESGDSNHQSFGGNSSDHDDEVQAGNDAWSIPSASSPPPEPSQDAPLLSAVAGEILAASHGAHDLQENHQSRKGVSSINRNQMQWRHSGQRDEGCFTDQQRAWELEVEEEIGAEGMEALRLSMVGAEPDKFCQEGQINKPGAQLGGSRLDSDENEKHQGQRKSKQSFANKANKVAGEASKLTQDIDFTELQLLHPPIGTGTYKTVYKAVWRGAEVAVLQVRQQVQGLELEVNLLHLFAQLRHPYLPAFYGVAKDHKDRWCLVSEYFALGGLDVQLEIWEGRLSSPVKLCISQQICEAMIVVHEHGVLHRDLATRNVLVLALDEQSVSEVWVKLTDFGLACNGPQLISSADDGLVPWRWAPPEVIKSGQWSTKSDVWSFGVTMWEIFTDALIPYCEINDDEVLKERIQDGNLHLEQPPACPEGVFTVMRACWQSIPAKRPDFALLANQLQTASTQSLQSTAFEEDREHWQALASSEAWRMTGMPVGVGSLYTF